MRVRIYKGISQPGNDRPPVLLDGIEFVRQDNAANGLVIHGPDRGGTGICIQAQPGQVFVRRDYGHLVCYEAGHEVVEASDEVVWNPRRSWQETDCPHCGKTLMIEEEL